MLLCMFINTIELAITIIMYLNEIECQVDN